MAYQGLTGAPTVFPKAPRLSAGEKKSLRGSSSPSGGRASAGSSRRKGKALKIPRTLTYPKVTAKNPLRAPSKTEIAIGALGAGRIIRGAKAAASSLRGMTVIPEAAGEASLGLVRAVPLAGIAAALAYELTKFGLNAYAMKKATARENAANAADAYRAARVKIAGDQGRPLTATQQKQLARLFKNRLIELGLSSRDLSKIMGRSAYDESAPPPTY